MLSLKVMNTQEWVDCLMLVGSIASWSLYTTLIVVAIGWVWKAFIGECLTGALDKRERLSLIVLFTLIIIAIGSFFARIIIRIAYDV